MGMLQLKLVRVPGVVGIYGPTKDQFPPRMSYLQVAASEAFQKASAALKLRVSDMFRTADESLRARATKKGVQPPGYSAHNYGLAIDIDTDAALASNKFNKVALDRAMESFGWWCHRKDGLRGMEDWHYNYLGVFAEADPFLSIAARSTVRSAAIEAKIVQTFGNDLLLTPEEAQIALARMKFYHGEIDGTFGNGSKEALKAFQRAWGLSESGSLDARTERTLAFVSAEILEIRPKVSHS